MQLLPVVSASSSGVFPGFPISLLTDANVITYTAASPLANGGEWLAVERPANSSVGWVRLDWNIAIYFQRVDVFVATTPGTFDVTAARCGTVENCAQVSCVAYVFCGHASAALPDAKHVVMRKDPALGSGFFVVAEVELYKNA